MQNIQAHNNDWNYVLITHNFKDLYIEIIVIFHIFTATSKRNTI